MTKEQKKEINEKLAKACKMLQEVYEDAPKQSIERLISLIIEKCSSQRRISYEEELVKEIYGDEKIAPKGYFM